MTVVIDAMKRSHRLHAVRFAVLGEPDNAPGGVLVGGRCLEGLLRVGDILTPADVTTTDGPARFTVLEIRRYADVIVDELEPNFSAQLLLAGDQAGVITADTTLVKAPEPS